MRWRAGAAVMAALAALPALPALARDREDEGFSPIAIVYHAPDRALFVLGHVWGRADGIRRPRVVPIATDGAVQAHRKAAFFGIGRDGPVFHGKDASVREWLFVDAVHGRVLALRGTRDEIRGELGRRTVEGPDSDRLLDNARFPLYGFQVAVDPAEERMWLAARAGGGGPYAWARDDRSGILWEGDEGVVRIHVGRGRPVEVRVNDFAVAAFPDERDGSAWICLSHERRELVHLDRSGRTIGTLPFLAFSGSHTPFAFDGPRQAIWYVDLDRTLVRLRLDTGAREVAIPLGDLPLAPGSERRCGPLTSDAVMLAAEADSGFVWVRCATRVLYRLDRSGNVLTSLAEPW